MGKVIKTERETEGKTGLPNSHSFPRIDTGWLMQETETITFLRPSGKGGHSLHFFFGPHASWLALTTCRCLAHSGGGCQWGRSSAVSEFAPVNVHTEPLEWLGYLTVTLSNGHIWFCAMLVTWEKHLFLGSFLNKCMCIQVDFVSVDGSWFVSSVCFKSQKEAVNDKHRRGRY